MKKHTRRGITIFLALILALTAINISVFAEDAVSADTTEAAEPAETAEETDPAEVSEAAEPADPAEATTESYTLERAVVLSRHNIRSPLSGSGSLLGDITPHEWFQWTSNPSELSLKGGILETRMGQYFRLWLENEGLFPENYRPEDDSVRIYANSKQRTLATAHYFSAGLLPAGNVSVESHGEYDTMDPTFNPVLTYFTDDYVEAVQDQIAEMGGDAGMEGFHDDLRDAITLLMDVTDMDESEAYEAGTYGDLLTDETTVQLEPDKEASMTGPIKTATSVADALTFQLYEMEDGQAAAFGHDLTTEDWQKLHTIVDTYTEILFETPLISVNAAHPLLEELRSEFETGGRKFSFLCGHDSNVATVLSALGTEEYLLPDAVEQHTPIGVKLVFSRWLNEDDEAFWSAELVYQNLDQLLDMRPLTLADPPAKYALDFEGVEKNADGLIAESDFMAMFDRAISAYDELDDQYGEMYALDNAA